MPSPNTLDMLRGALRVREFAELAGKSISGARRDVRLGLVPSFRVGKAIRIPREALADSIARTIKGVAD